MASKHSSMQMFICMPINKCAPRLKLQYTVQIQQSEWHSPCTSHQCLALLQTEHHASPNCTLTSKTRTKMGSEPRDRRSDGGEKEGEQLRRSELIIVKLKIRLHMQWLYFKPSISPMNLQFLLFKSLFVNILQVTESYFSLLSLPHLCCAVSLFQSLTLPLGKSS